MTRMKHSFKVDYLSSKYLSDSLYSRDKFDAHTNALSFDSGGEGAGAAPVYFQSWKDGKQKINYGKDGLQAFDNVVKQAEKYDIKLLVALTNNWADYGVCHSSPLEYR